MDLEKKFLEIKELINDMQVKDFDEMLLKCGIENIKPSIDSAYVKCIWKEYGCKQKEYLVKKNNDNCSRDCEFELLDEGVA